MYSKTNSLCVILLCFVNQVSLLNVFHPYISTSSGNKVSTKNLQNLHHIISLWRELTHKLKGHIKQIPFQNELHWNLPDCEKTFFFCFLYWPKRTLLLTTTAPSLGSFLLTSMDISEHRENIYPMSSSMGSMTNFSKTIKHT